MIELSRVVDWIWENGVEESLQGPLDLEIGAERSYKQEEFSGIERAPFLYYLVWLTKPLMLRS